MKRLQITKWNDLEISVPADVRIIRTHGGYSVELWTNVKYKVGSMVFRLCKTIKHYNGNGAKKRCHKFVKDNNLNLISD
jgi:hypothetical protein